MANDATGNVSVIKSTDTTTIGTLIRELDWWHIITLNNTSSHTCALDRRLVTMPA